MEKKQKMNEQTEKETKKGTKKKKTNYHWNATQGAAVTSCRLSLLLSQISEEQHSLHYYNLLYVFKMQ